MNYSKTEMKIKPKRAKRKKGFLYEIQKHRFLYLMTLPAVIFIFINSYLPMLGIVLAFEDYKLDTGFFSKFVGFKNFEFLFKSPNAWIITRNTLLYNLVFIVLGLLLAVSFAIALDQIRNRRLSKIYQSILFLPYFLSYIVVTYLVYALLSNKTGIINNSILPFFGLKPIQWYTNPKYWPFILVIVHVWKSVGYSTVIYLAGITGIDATYYEAAIVDGATKFQQIRHITLPGLKPLMIITTILALGGIFRSDFGLFYQVTMNIGSLYTVTDTIDTYVYRSLVVMGNTGMAAAAGLYQSVVGLITILSANFLVRKIDRENSLF